MRVDCHQMELLISCVRNTNKENLTAKQTNLGWNESISKSSVSIRGEGLLLPIIISLAYPF